MTFDSDKPVGHVLGTGTWRDLLPRIPRSVWAIGKERLYRVLLEGSGFPLPLADGEPIVGFFSTRFVAAANIRDAEMKARSSVLREWKRRGYEHAAGASPLLHIEGLEVIDSRFTFRSGAGFSFFNTPAETD